MSLITRSKQYSIKDPEKQEEVPKKNLLSDSKRLRLLSTSALLLLLIPYFTSLFPSQPSPLYHRSDPLASISTGRGIDISPLKREPSLDPNPKHLKKSLKGAVASDIDICSELGVGTLKKGGNAADAAVTVALCIGSINSFNSGIGGGGYIVSKRYKENAISIDAREAAPFAAHKNMYKGREYLSKVGGLASGVPGELKGLYRLFELQGSGRLTWKQTIEPVYELLREGWNVSDVLAAAIEADKDFFRNHPDDWGYVFKNGSTYDVLESGDLITRPRLANTLELIANNGSDSIFYDPDGPIASNLIKTNVKHGGIFTNEDFATYDVDVYDALHTKYLDNDVYTCAGSCTGPALISGLKIMNNYGVQEGKDMDPLATHHLIETMKWMSSGRSRLGDPLTNETVVITSDDWVEYARSHINDEHTLKHWTEYKPAYEPNEPHGTTSFSVVDEEHNAVVMTSTVNLLFGSLVRDVTTGVILNNQMDDFSVPGVPNAFGVEPSVYNFIRPKKRPLSSSVPTIVVNELGKPDLIIGAAGGSRIYTAVFQAIVRTYSYNMPLLETLSYPRIHHQLLPDRIEHEIRIGTDIIEALQSKGHETLEQVPKTAMNAIRRWQGEWHAVSDYWRKRGEAAVI